MKTKHFSNEELSCPCCGVNLMNEIFMECIEDVRTIIDIPLIISSGYRCLKHNVEVSSTGERGPHVSGKAIDILIAGANAYKLVQIAMGMSVFTGIGINQKGDWNKRFIHLDSLTNENRPRIWTY